MGIRYKFASAKEFSEIPIDGSVISVSAFKRKVVESKYKSKKKSDSNGLCLGTDLDFIVVNAQTNEEYEDDSVSIADHTTILLRRVPGSRRRRPIDTTAILFLETQIPLSSSSRKTSAATNSTNSVSGLSSEVSTVTSSSSTKSRHDSRFHCDDYQFGGDFSTTIPGLDGSDDEDSKIKALVNTPALDWNNRGVKCGRRYRRMGFRLDKKTPHEGYICRRCGMQGHFIQDCPTNGDPNYDFKRMKPAAAPVLPQNEAAFDREIGCIALKKSLSASDVPPELLCPLCKQVMRDAAMTSKCCLNSFCDIYIRDHLILSKLQCICGATKVLTDSLIPNITLRYTIKRILEVGLPCNSSSAEISTTTASSAVLSAAELSDCVQDMGYKRKYDNVPQFMAKKARTTEAPEVSAAKIGSTRLKAPADQGSIQAAAEKVQQKIFCAEKVKKKKQSKTCQDVDARSCYMMPVASYAYNPYYYGMQAGMEGCIAPYYHGCGNGITFGSFGIPFVM